MSNEKPTVAPAVKIIAERNAGVLANAGMTLDDFVGLSVDKVREIIQDLKSAAGMTDSNPLGQSSSVPTQNGGADGEITEIEYMGIPVEQRTYGTGRERRVYKNARLFDGAAYMNISLPMGDSKLKLAGINLQDLSEATPADNGTRRGRATLLRLIKEHGLNKCGKIEFTVELNVAELMEDHSEEFDQAIEAYFQTAPTK